MKSLKLTLDGLGSGDVKRKDVLCGLMKKVWPFVEKQR